RVRTAGCAETWPQPSSTGVSRMQSETDEALDILRGNGHEWAQHDPDPDLTTAPWPEQLADEAYHGLAGEWVRLIGPETEADPAALLIQMLVAIGNLIGRGPHFVAE